MLIATVGVAPCFLLNALTFAGMIAALRAMDPARLNPPAKPDGDRDGVRAALRYLRGEPALLIPLVMMAVVGTLAFNFHVLLPLLGRFTFDGGAGAYTALAVSMAIGSVAGALTTGARGRVSERLIAGSAAAFGLFALLAAAAPSLGLAMVALVPLGAVSVTFAAAVNSTLQLKADPVMRGRVMALYSVVFLGSTPFGGPLVGWLAEVAGPRSGLVLAGIAALATGIGGWIAFNRRRDPEFKPLDAALAGLGRRRWGRLPAGGAVAVQAGGAQQLDGLERVRGLDVEARPVALLDRGDGPLAAAPSERDEDREAGADRRDLGLEAARDANGEREEADRPQAHERDSRRAFRRQAGRGSRACEQPRDRLRRPLRASEPDAERRAGDPPARRERERDLVGILVGDDDAHRAEGRRHAGDEQSGHSQ